MERLDLSYFGLAQIELNGRELYRCQKQGPPILLFDEEHYNKEAISCSLRDAVALIDAGLVDLVCTEDDARIPLKDGVSYEHNSQELLDQFGGDEGVIREAAKKERMVFGRTLRWLRGGADIETVDDQTLRSRADGINIVMTKQLRSRGWSDDEIIQKFRADPIHLARERAFIDNLLSIRGRLGKQRATLLNAGM
jgi:hypothetical protein